MEPKYGIGQKVKIKKVETQTLSVRDSDLKQYIGQSGTVTNYYGMRPNWGDDFYIYSVRLDNSQKIMVLYEDEITLS